MWRTVIHGQPAPKGSLQPFLQWIGGKPVARVREDETVAHKAWRKLVGVAGTGIRKAAGDIMHEGPIRLWATVTLPRPESVKPEKRWWPWKQSEKHGDADKLARMIGDALADSKVFVNDAQICDLRLIKCYPDTPGVVDRLEAPGAVVRLGPIEDLPVKLSILDHFGAMIDVQRDGQLILLGRETPGGVVNGGTLTADGALQLARALEHEAREAALADDQEVLV